SLLSWDGGDSRLRELAGPGTLRRADPGGQPARSGGCPRSSSALLCPPAAEALPGSLLPPRRLRRREDAPAARSGRVASRADGRREPPRVPRRRAGSGGDLVFGLLRRLPPVREVPRRGPAAGDRRALPRARGGAGSSRHRDLDGRLRRIQARSEASGPLRIGLVALGSAHSLRAGGSRALQLVRPVDAAAGLRRGPAQELPGGERRLEDPRRAPFREAPLRRAP